MGYPAECMHSFRRDQRGQLTVLFALGLFTLLLFLTLTVNIGQAAVRRHQVQFIADMGALTGSSVQARGLNLMTRLNALSLRTFNVFSVRSRVSGYRNHRIPLLSIARRLIPVGPATMWAGDEKDAFKNMDQIFSAIRVSIHAANTYYEILARQAAYDVTERNVKSLVGPDNWTTLNQEHLIARPVMSVLPGLNFDNLFSLNGLMDMINMVRGMSGSFSGLATGVTGVRPLIPNFAEDGGKEGDLLVVRYWTDLSDWHTTMYAAAYAAAVCLPAIEIPPVYAACVVLWEGRFERLIGLEDKIRWVDGPAYHEMRVTLHRAEGKENDTHFLFWARLPTTSSAMGSLVFADMPSMVAFSAARPVGGSFGTKPKPTALGSNIPRIGWILSLLGAVNIQPSEHLDDSYKYKMEYLDSKDGRLPSIYWYHSWQIPEYQPRLVPIERRYLDLTGHQNLKNERERLNLPEDYWEQIDRMVQMYRQ